MIRPDIGNVLMRLSGWAALYHFLMRHLYYKPHVPVVHFRKKVITPNINVYHDEGKGYQKLDVITRILVTCITMKIIPNIIST